MKRLKMFMLPMLVLCLVVPMAFVLTACGGNGNGDDPTTTPIVLTPNAVTINNANPERTVTVTGTATGDVTLNISALPSGVTATVSGTTITITGTRPTTENAPAITGTHNIVVTRDGETRNLAVTVNLTTSWTSSGNNLASQIIGTWDSGVEVFDFQTGGVFRTRQSGSSSWDQSGTYTLNGTTINLTHPTWGTQALTNVSVSGNNLTMTSPNGTRTFTRV